MGVVTFVPWGCHIRSMSGPAAHSNRLVGGHQVLGSPAENDGFVGSCKQVGFTVKKKIRVQCVKWPVSWLCPQYRTLVVPQTVSTLRPPEDLQPRE